VKKLFGFLFVLLFVFFFVGCTDNQEIPEINIDHESITLKTGDTLDLMDGVTAKGLKGEDVIDLVIISHEIPLDSNGKLTSTGTYLVTFTLTIEGKSYTKTLSVTVNNYTPLITVLHKSINLYVGDELTLMEGVSATGLINEDVTNQVTVSHSIPVDDDGKVTTAGSYTVTYQLTISDLNYQDTATFIVEDNRVPVSITNGDFESGTMLPFVKSDFEGANSSTSIVEMSGNHLLKLDITAVSWGSASPRIEYSGLELDSSKIYQISFDAYADAERAMHVQVGELLTASPWYHAAFAQTRYFDLTTESQTYTWRFQPTSTLSGADLSNLSLLFEFGTIENRTSVATNVYLDNFVIEEVNELEVDTTAPVLVFKEDKEYFYLNDYFLNLTTKYIAVIDERGESLELFIDEALSNIPAINDESRLTVSGFYHILFYAIDSSGNKGTLAWDFEVKDAYPVTNGFNLIDFLSGTASDITEGNTHNGYVYAVNPESTYEYAEGTLTIVTAQSQLNDPWTATQVFIRTVRQEGFSGEGAKKFTLSFDFTSNVEGYIQVNGLPFKVEIGSTHIAIEGNIFNYNYKDVTIVLGVHRSLMSPEQNIGPSEVSISNLSFVMTQDIVLDTIPPVIMLNSTKTYFVGDDFNLLSTVKLSDFRGSTGATLVVDEANSDIIPVSEGKVTTAGIYHVTFIATDASGNTSNYEFEYVVKDVLVNSDGFSIEQITFGEEGLIDDPSIVFLWHDSAVNVTSEVIDRNNFRFTSDQALGTDVPWYSTQLFFKSLVVDTWGLYELSFDIVSDVAGHITVMNEGIEIQAGTNTIYKKVAIQAGGYQKITMQLGRNTYGTLGPCEIEIRNLSLALFDIPEGNYWEGYGMTVTNNTDNSVISYSNIPESWSIVNARTYIFDATSTYQAVAIEFIGTAGHRYQFKFEGISTSIYNASSIEATGETQRIIIDTRNRTEEQRLSMFNLLMFVESVGVSGTITINSYTFYEDFTDAFGTIWLGMGMNVVDVDEISHVTYSNTPSNWWNANAQLPMNEMFTENSESVSFTFTGVEGHVYLFKVEGGGYSKEAAITATGLEQVFTLDISSIGTNVSKLNLAIMFCQSVGASGTIILGNVAVNETS